MIGNDSSRYDMRVFKAPLTTPINFSEEKAENAYNAINQIFFFIDRLLCSDIRLNSEIYR